MGLNAKQLPCLRRSPRTPRWLWLHLLSLDAPLVAVVWQEWWAHSAGIRVSWGQEVILGLGVWSIYLADRLADTAPQAASQHDTARHAFYRRHRRTMLPIAAAVFGALVVLAPWVLPCRQFVAGLGLLAITGGYFGLIHWRSGREWSRILPKEVVVAGIFAAGSAFFVVGQMHRATPALLGGVPLFGGLCFLNCALIAKWERDPSDVLETASLLNAFPRLTGLLGAGCAILASLAFAAWIAKADGGVFLPIAVSAGLLAILDRCRLLLCAEALRVLADAVLLTPLFCYALPLM